MGLTGLTGLPVAKKSSEPAGQGHPHRRALRGLTGLMGLMGLTGLTGLPRVAKKSSEPAGQGHPHRRALRGLTGLTGLALRAHALTSSSAGAKNGGEALLALADGADTQLKAAAAGGVEAIIQTLQFPRLCQSDSARAA